MAETTTDRDWVKEVGEPAAASLVEMVACLEADRERLEELREERDGYEPNDGEERLAQTECETLAELWAFDNSDDAQELADLVEAVTLDGYEQDEEQARERIQEDALSVRIFGERADGEWEADRFEILLATGGPAVRIMGELDANNEPKHAWLEVQDWGKPWTEYYDSGLRDTLLTYARCFCFGE